MSWLPPKDRPGSSSTFSGVGREPNSWWREPERPASIALVVTLDTQITANREREARHHMTPPLKVDLRTMAKMAPQVSVRLSWLADVAHDRFHLEIANAASLAFAGRAVSTEEALSRWTKAPARWEDFAWLREQWPGSILAKGVDHRSRCEDARSTPVLTPIIVSNHGGRQLDCVPGALRSLIEVVEAVGPQTEVLVDGGFRRGQDVVKAIALGARAVMVGRPWAYGLAAAGERGSGPGARACSGTISTAP